jgi:hypothetical protein
MADGGVVGDHLDGCRFTAACSKWMSGRTRAKSTMRAESFFRVPRAPLTRCYAVHHADSAHGLILQRDLHGFSGHKLGLAWSRWCGRNLL